jgi:histidinol-phosphate aminotransferase
MKVRQPYSVDAFAQWIATKVFRERVVFEARIRDIMRERDRLLHGLSDFDEVQVFPSEANFVMFRVEHAGALWRDLLHNHSVLIRDLSRAPGLEDCLRVTVGSAEENVRFLEAMGDALAHRRESELLTTGAEKAHAASMGAGAWDEDDVDSQEMGY